MSAVEPEYRPPFNVMCPVCESPHGFRCRTTSGTNRTTDTHTPRFDRAYGIGHPITTTEEQT